MIPIVQCTYVISTHANERVDVEWIHYLLPSHVCMVMSYKNILGVPLPSLSQILSWSNQRSKSRGEKASTSVAQFPFKIAPSADIVFLEARACVTWAYWTSLKLHEIPSLCFFFNFFANYLYVCTFYPPFYIFLDGCTTIYQDTASTNSNNSQCLVWHSIGWSALHTKLWGPAANTSCVM